MMTDFGPPDDAVPLPGWRYPLDREALAYAERRVAEGKSDYGAIKEAIRVVNPSPNLPASTALNRLTGRFRAKHGPKSGRKPLSTDQTGIFRHSL